MSGSLYVIFFIYEWETNHKLQQILFVLFMYSLLFGVSVTYYLDSLDFQCFGCHFYCFCWLGCTTSDTIWDKTREPVEEIYSSLHPLRQLVFIMQHVMNAALNMYFKCKGSQSGGDWGADSLTSEIRTFAMSQNCKTSKAYVFLWPSWWYELLLQCWEFLKQFCKCFYLKLWSPVQ